MWKQEFEQEATERTEKERRPGRGREPIRPVPSFQLLSSSVLSVASCSNSYISCAESGRVMSTSPQTGFSLRLLWARARRPRPAPFATLREGARAGPTCGVAVTLAAFVGIAAAVETAVPQWLEPDYGHR